MPLNEAEVKAEDLQQLKQLVRSPAWAMYRTRLLKLAQRRESGKASLLRQASSDLGEARYAQGIIDGLEQAMSEIDKSIQELEIVQDELVGGY